MGVDGIQIDGATAIASVAGIWIESEDLPKLDSRLTPVNELLDHSDVSKTSICESFDATGARHFSVHLLSHIHCDRGTR
jgi:hypothetical protein